MSDKEEVKYLFRAKTKETDAYVIKILGEVLSNIVKWSPFSVNENGIQLNQRDPKNEQLISIALHRSEFHVFKCIQPINFLVNSSTFYTLVKAIKKKDTVTMFITEDEPLKLGITVEQNAEKNKVTTYIKISYHRPEDIQLGTQEEYGNPLIISSKEYQKMKNLQSISHNGELKLTCHQGELKFFCDGGEVYSRELIINTEQEEEGENIPVHYEQTYKAQCLTQLTKCAGQSGNTVHMFIKKDLPLKIKMRAGNLGELTVYIKSKEMLDLEDGDEEDDESQS